MKAKKKISAARWSAIRLFAMDVDGVLTDGTVGILSDGRELKFFSILDGRGLLQLRQAGFELAWISGRFSEATSRRAAELKIGHVVQGQVDKLTGLREIAAKLGLEARQCAYMGDDDLDVPAILWAGIGLSVPDAVAVARAAAGYVTRLPAGRGAVREVCDLLLAARKGA